jgi:hypothetical protein
LVNVYLYKYEIFFIIMENILELIKNIVEQILLAQNNILLRLNAAQNMLKHSGGLI